MSLFRLALIVGALPSTLINGTTADATQVMADLNWIVNQVNANAAPLATTALTNANNNFTTVQSGQAATQPANFPIASQIENNALQTLSSVLGTNTITARISAIPLPSYVSGQVFTFYPSNANTGAATENIDGLGARSILNMGSSLSGAELQPYRPAVIAFNGGVNAFDLVNGTPYVQGPNIPSAATLNLDGTPGDYSQVDGTVNITAMTLSRGRQKLLEFTSSPLITQSATLLLPRASSITPAAGDTAIVRGEAGSVVRCIFFSGDNVKKAFIRVGSLANSSGANEDLMSYLIPANVFSIDGRGIRVTAWGTTANNANVKEMDMIFGATTIRAATLTINSVNAWRIQAEIFRTGPNAQTFFAFESASISAGGSTTQGTAAETDIAAITVKCRALPSAAGDLIQNGLLVEFL